jgi:hypothetical protein
LDLTNAGSFLIAAWILDIKASTDLAPFF